MRGVTPSNWLWPDYSTMGWPEIGAASYAVLHQRIEEIAREMPFATRPNKLFWRGKLDMNVRLLAFRPRGTIPVLAAARPRC